MSTPTDFSVLNVLIIFLTSCPNIGSGYSVEFFFEGEGSLMLFYYMPYTGVIFIMMDHMINDYMIMDYMINGLYDHGIYDHGLYDYGLYDQRLYDQRLDMI